MIALRIFSAWRESSQRHIKPIDLVLSYFWITAILHYLLSLSYCVDCIIPYTNYNLPLGALAAAGSIEGILRLTGERRLAYLALGALLIVAAMLQAFPSFPTLLRPRTGMVRMAATELAAQLRPNLPATGRILVLCDSVEAAQAVWLAGGVVEPRSIYLPSTFRAPKPELSRKERDRIDSIIWDAGLWSEDSMRNAFTQGFSSTLLIERRQRYCAGSDGARWHSIRRRGGDAFPTGRDLHRSRPNVRTLPAARTNLFNASLHFTGRGFRDGPSFCCELTSSVPS